MKICKHGNQIVYYWEPSKCPVCESEKLKEPEYCECFCHFPVHEDQVVRDFACGCDEKEICLIKESE